MGWATGQTVAAGGEEDKDVLPGMELMSCPDLAVPREVMHHVVHVESSFNPYAIGVVGGRLVRQPRSLPEALSTVRMLEQRGYNFSIGLAQVNRYNLAKYGLTSYEQAFQPCANLQAGSRILRECYGRSGGDWGKSFSCYYSGDFRTGYRHGYVQKVYASMRRGNEAGAGVAPIAVVDRAQRRVRSGRKQVGGGGAEVAATTSLVARRAAALQEAQAQAPATTVAQSTPQYAATDASSRMTQATQAPAAAMNAAGTGMSTAQSETASPPSVQPIAQGGPVVVTATRLGAPSPQAPGGQGQVAGQEGGDGAFVF